MNKINKQIVPACIIVAILAFFILTFMLIKPQYEEYSEMQLRMIKNSADIQNYEEQLKLIEAENETKKLKFKSLKPIYESTEVSATENLGMFGNMFEEIIKRAQNNGLLIRSIEYDMRPYDDPIFKEDPNTYNICELKFFFVGSFAQLQMFLHDINNKFEYLMYISKLNVTSFASNTDYLLINTSITLYSKKK